METLNTSDLQTINLVPNAQGFLLFLQGEPLKPSSGKYSEEIFLKLRIYRVLSMEMQMLAFCV